jgi:uncharacterized protein YjbI with pentapeptide repeats
LGANLNRADLEIANLIEAHLGEADLSRANLIEADLNEADLSRANLIGADRAVLARIGHASMAYRHG